MKTPTGSVYGQRTAEPHIRPMLALFEPMLNPCEPTLGRFDAMLEVSV